MRVARASFAALLSLDEVLLDSSPGLVVGMKRDPEVSNSGDTRDSTGDDNVNILEFSNPGHLKTLGKYLHLISVLFAGPETKKRSKMLN